MIIIIVMIMIIN